jgi:signal transduction histidine kinase
VSESPAYVPPFARAARESVPPLRAGDVDRDVDGEFDDGAAEADLDADADADPDADGPSRADAAPRAREGLPPSYRMRAEPHYVEALVDRSLAAFEPAVAAANASGDGREAPDLPAVPVTASSAAIAAAATALADAFDTIQAALRDLPVRGRPLRDRVALELARAEATRGRWLADAAVVLQTDPLPALDELDLVQLLGAVFEAFGPENRLSGGADAWPLPPGTCLVFGDERLLTTALGALLSAVRALIEDRGDARKVTVSLGPRREAAMRTLEVAQRAVRLPAAAYARFFDADWPEHPAGPSGALLLAAARRIAVAHGGTLDVAAVDGGGCRLTFGLPAAD